MVFPDSVFLKIFFEHLKKSSPKDKSEEYE